MMVTNNSLSETLLSHPHLVISSLPSSTDHPTAEDKTLSALGILPDAHGMKTETRASVTSPQAAAAAAHAASASAFTLSGPSMGQALGHGTGMGRVGASVLSPPHSAAAAGAPGVGGLQFPGAAAAAGAVPMAWPGATVPTPAAAAASAGGFAAFPGPAAGGAAPSAFAVPMPGQQQGQGSSGVSAGPSFNAFNF